MSKIIIFCDSIAGACDKDSSSTLEKKKESFGGDCKELIEVILFQQDQTITIVTVTSNVNVSNEY